MDMDERVLSIKCPTLGGKVDVFDTYRNRVARHFSSSTYPGSMMSTEERLEGARNRTECCQVIGV